MKKNIFLQATAIVTLIMAGQSTNIHAAQATEADVQTQEVVTPAPTDVATPAPEVIQETTPAPETTPEVKQPEQKVEETEKPVEVQPTPAVEPKPEEVTSSTPVQPMANQVSQPSSEKKDEAKVSTSALGDSAASKEPATPNEPSEKEMEDAMKQIQEMFAEMEKESKKAEATNPAKKISNSGA